MPVGGWVITLLLIAGVCLVQWRRRRRMRRCVDGGHQWQADKDGFHCERCPLRHDVGDQM